MSTDAAAGAPPLAGLRVLDLTRVLAGNILGHFLADLGAEVVKIEPPEGDALRHWLVQGQPTWWQTYCRNKKSLCLDLRAPGGIELVLKLAASAAILVENFRPGTLEKMGLSPERLHAANPRLVIVRISGFGQDGPYAQRPGLGSLVEAMSGFASINGFADREPVLPPAALADNFAGLYGAASALVALRHVELSGGRGQVIDVPLLDPLFAMIGPSAADYELTGRPRPRMGSRCDDATAPRNAYRTCDDKWVAISAPMQSVAERLFHAIGRPDLIADPRFCTNTERCRNAEALDEIIAAYIRGRDRAPLLEQLTAADVTVALIYDIADILQDPHVQARQMVRRGPDGVLAHGVVPRFSATPGVVARAAPRLGEDTRDLLAGAGVAPAEIEALLARGAARQA